MGFALFFEFLPVFYRAAEVRNDNGPPNDHGDGKNFKDFFSPNTSLK
jgi:hypothetical protein